MKILHTIGIVIVFIFKYHDSDKQKLLSRAKNGLWCNAEDCTISRFSHVKNPIFRLPLPSQGSLKTYYQPCCSHSSNFNCTRAPKPRCNSDAKSLFSGV